MTMSRKWSLLAGVVVVAVFAAGWFLLIAPKRSEAADLEAKRQETATANEQLVQSLQQLKEQSQDVPRLTAELATMRKQIPDNPALPALIRDLTAAGKKAGVTVVSLQPSTPSVVAADPAVPVASTTTPPATTTTDTTTTGTTAGAAGAVPAPAAAAPALYEVPLKLTVSGNYFAVEEFVNKLERLRRSFQVTGFSLTPAASAAGSNALTLDLSGRVFLSPTVAPAVAAAPVAAATPATAASPAATPAAGTTTP